VQTAGGALPGALSRDAAELRERGLIAGHVTVSPCFGGEHEAISLTGALHAAADRLGWDAIVAGPGPGILGSGSALGHGGMQALDTAHAALALGCRTLLVARMSSTDGRVRHRGLSHHTRIVLDLLLAPVSVAVPAGSAPDDASGKHEWLERDADVDGYAQSGLPTRSMGREDPLFFAAAMAAGGALAEMAAR
jgi:hypothetical protein